MYKTFVINLEARSDRLANVKKAFSSTSLELIRWEAIYGKKLSDNDIKQVTTKKCYYFCSPSMIGCWLSHYGLWLHIVNKGYDKVIILEDDTYPVDKNFDILLQEYLKDVPSGWDMIYLGCFGSCDTGLLEKNFFYMYGGKNRGVYKNGQLLKHIIKPGFPLGTHAYMLSYQGAKKLVNSGMFNKADYHLDHHLAKYISNNPDFKVYAFVPPLISQNLHSQYSDNQAPYYSLLSKVTHKINISDQHTLDSILSIQTISIRKLGINITLLALLLFILSFIIGYSNKGIKYYLFIISCYYLSELIYTKGKYCKDLSIELLLIYVFVYLGKKL